MGIVKVIFIAYLVSLWVIGCSSAPKIANEPIFDPNATESGKSTVKHSIGNPAIWSLWQQSKEAEELGDLTMAVTQIERAIRIEAEDAILWSRLAELNLKQGNANQAEELAKKSNSLSVDNNVLVYRNWLIIAKSRRLVGDDIGAQEAEYTADTFR